MARRSSAGGPGRLGPAALVALVALVVAANVALAVIGGRDDARTDAPVATGAVAADEGGTPSAQGQDAGANAVTEGDLEVQGQPQASGDEPASEGTPAPQPVEVMVPPGTDEVAVRAQVTSGALAPAGVTAVNECDLVKVRTLEDGTRGWVYSAVMYDGSYEEGNGRRYATYEVDVHPDGSVTVAAQ